MHKGGIGHSREERVRQVREKEASIHDYASYVPIGDAAEKLKRWQKDGAEILYLTSRRRSEEIEQIRDVLKKHGFPEGELLYRLESEGYKDVAERIVPGVLIEDDCESIGGTQEMTITHVRLEIRKEIKGIAVREFGGVEHLPDNASSLVNY